MSKDHHLRTWEIDDGLPHNRVMSIAQTPDGYLWFATPYGVARFDGVRFTPFWETLSASEERDHAYAVFVARDGALWISSINGGVGRWLHGRMEIIVAETPGGQPVNAFAGDGEGAVWFGVGGEARVGRWSDGRLTWFSAADGIRTGRSGANRTMVAATKTGRLWYSSTDTCGWFDGRRFTLVDPEAGAYIHLAPAAEGGMWALRDRSLVRYHADGRKEVVAEDLGTLSVHVLFEDSRGTLWIGSNNAGLIRYRNGEFERIPVAGSVTTLFEDDEGALWVGTSAGGVARLVPRRLFLRTIDDGLSDDETYSICGDAGGRLWLAGRNRMLVRGDDPGNRSFSPPAGWVNERGVMTVVPAPDGGVWLGTLGGLVHWRNGEVRREAFQEPLTALLTDRAGDLWMATTRGGLFRRQGAEYIAVGAAEGIPGIIALAEDGAGRVWAGGLDGQVFFRENGKFHRVELPGVGTGDAIRFIAPDGPDTVWIGAFRRGLYRWRAGGVSRLPEGAGLPVRDVRSLAAGSSGDFWIGTTRGLFQVPRVELEAVLDGDASTLAARSYGRHDGLPTAEFALGFRGATARTSDGHLWFATARGALDIDLHAMVERPIGRRVLIEEIWSGDRLIARGGAPASIELPPRAPRLRINYTVPHAGKAERLRFRYRLLGAGDDDWVESGELRTAAFSHLPAGSYRFEAMAGMDDGTWLPTSAGVDFTVRATWWETPFARASMGALALAALVWSVRLVVLLRVRARIRRLRESRELERERTRIARDMHDELGANLTHIRLISQLARQEPAEAVGGHLEEISGVARRTVDALNEIVWAVNPRYDTLGALIEYLGMFAASFLASARIAFETELPGDLPARPLSANVRYHLFLAVKEALNNAVKHAGARLVRLQVGFDGERLNVVVEDDGRGFAPEDARAGSNGLRNLRERLAELNGECRVESAPGRGTRVVFMLPLSSDGSGLADTATPDDSDMPR